MTEAAFRGAVDALLAGSPEDARERALTAWPALAEDRPVVLFGAGGLGRRVARRMADSGRPPVAFVDNDARRWGTEIEGVPVVSPEDGTRRWANDATWLVSIFGAGQRHRFPDTTAQLNARGVHRVASFATFAWHEPETWLPYYPLGLPDVALRAGDRVREAATHIREPRSQAEFLGQLRWRVTGDYAALPAPAPEASEYFDDTLLPWRGGWYLDAGAYDGDTLERFHQWTGGAWAGVVAVEADPGNARALEARARRMGVESRVRVAAVALAGRTGVLRFDAGAGAASALSASGSMEVPARRLAEVAGDARPSLVKLDIEGAELEVLDDAADLLGDWGADLVVCSYHRPDHLWEVPLRVAAITGAPVRLRAYGSEGYDLVSYARGRVLPGSAPTGHRD